MVEKEYIEREALKSKLKNMEATSPNKVYQNAMEDMIYYFIPKIIDEIPSANVALVRHGHWIECNYGLTFECSECKYPTEYNLTDYCPNCGARMDGDKNG